VPIQLNHNIGVMPFWAVTLWTAWNSFEKGRPLDWVLLGLAVGGGLWAKYSILHLIVPLSLLVFIVPEWRRRLIGPGPWLAILVAALAIAPHALDVAAKGATTLRYAGRAGHFDLLMRWWMIAEFLFQLGLMHLPMALIAAGAAGLRPLLATLRQKPDRFGLFLAVAAFGPPLVVVIATCLGVRPRPLWLTPFMLSAAVFWGHAASRALAGAAPSRRAIQIAAGFAALLVVSYLGAHIFAPRFGNPHYSDMNGPALARLAEDYWHRQATGPVPYIVSLGEQKGRQAGGSIAFDLPYRVQVVEEGDLTIAPWIDPIDLARRGALVVSTRPLFEGETVLGSEVAHVETVARPLLKPAPNPIPIYFGILPPQAQTR
jgi:hypothetical protein